MTTIVYDHKRGQIACDSRLTKGSMITTDGAQKWMKTENGIIFMAGCRADFEMLSALTVNYSHGDVVETEFELQCEGILVKDDHVYLISIQDGGQFWMEPLDEAVAATGSGSEWAIAAIDHGKTAKQAVEYAATRDIYTGGKVRVYDIKKGKFING